MLDAELRGRIDNRICDRRAAQRRAVGRTAGTVDGLLAVLTVTELFAITVPSDLMA